MLSKNGYWMRGLGCLGRGVTLVRCFLVSLGSGPVVEGGKWVPDSIPLVVNSV